MKDIVPSSDFCAPAKMTSDDSIIMGCVTETESNCLNTCKWYKGTGENTNPELPVIEYCHSKDRSSSTYDITSDKCTVNKAAADCAAETDCEWGSIDLNNLIPTDVCMPTDITKMSDQDAVAQCTAL
jgi:hypothetical protein